MESREVKMLLRGSSSAGSSSRSGPFTAKQWQELEHQAIIFEYMVSGLPIPSELIYVVKTSFDSSSRLLFPHRPSIGWWPGCFQADSGRKVDPEPGRCRRTDGKKWRCSKDVCPDSKYCERHMHRGRNRSRKLTTHRNLNTVVGGSGYPIASSRVYSHHHNPFIHSQSRTPAGSFQNESSGHFLNSGADKNHRFLDERVFFPESSLTMSSYKGCSSECQSYNNNSMQQEEQHFRSATTSTTRLMKEDGDEGDPTQKQFHYFFGVWPPTNTATDSWYLNVLFPILGHLFYSRLSFACHIFDLVFLFCRYLKNGS